MKRSCWLAIAATVAMAASRCGSASEKTIDTGRAITFAAFGDTPYSNAEVQAVPRLVDQVNAAGVEFSVFLGDLKGGGRCENAHLTGAVDAFNGFSSPVVYTPGDNEWTDCHAYAQDPLERLDRIRRTMFATSRSFGRRTLDLEQQRPSYPENGRWRIGSVQFVTLNVPGSNDNHIADPDVDEPGTPRTAADRRAAEAEFQARDAADRAWLHDAFVAAARHRASMVVMFMQADPAFDVIPADRVASQVDGYDALLDALAREAAAFVKPVVVVHGDSHRYRVDQPLVDPATRTPIANVTRVESYGSPDVGWVAVTLEPGGPQPVRVEPHLVASAPGG